MPIAFDHIRPGTLSVGSWSKNQSYYFVLESCHARKSYCESREKLWLVSNPTVILRQQPNRKLNVKQLKQTKKTTKEGKSVLAAQSSSDGDDPLPTTKTEHKGKLPSGSCSLEYSGEKTSKALSVVS
jgi:hypothetical protein